MCRTSFQLQRCWQAIGLHSLLPRAMQDSQDSSGRPLPTTESVRINTAKLLCSSRTRYWQANPHRLTNVDWSRWALQYNAMTAYMSGRLIIRKVQSTHFLDEFCLTANFNPTAPS